MIKTFKMYFVGDNCNIDGPNFEVGDKRKCHEKDSPPHGTCINENNSEDDGGFVCLCKPPYFGADCTPGSYN